MSQPSLHASHHQGNSYTNTICTSFKHAYRCLLPSKCLHNHPVHISPRRVVTMSNQATLSRTYRYSTLKLLTFVYIPVSVVLLFALSDGVFFSYNLEERKSIPESFHCWIWKCVGRNTRNLGRMCCWITFRAEKGV